MTLSELREALEKADGPSRELDALLHIYLTGEDDELSVQWAHDCSGYTESLDAAVGLVERVLPGWRRMVVQIDRSFQVSLSSDDCGPEIADHASEPIAIMIALARAMEAERGNE